MTLSTLTMERAHDEAMDGEPNLPDRPRRRRFSAAYKLSLLDKYDRCVGDGDKGALLRREGLYSSHVVEWRRARDAGALVGLTTKPRKDRPAPEQLQQTKIRLAGLKKGAKVRVLFEDRTIIAEDGYFVDDFRGVDLYQRYGGERSGYGNAPVALHIYEVNP